MNIFDIIVYLSLAWAVFNGWRRGFLMQMLSLLAVVAALFLATQYGAELEQMFGIDVGVEGVVGFIIIFLVSMILIALFGYLLRAVFRFAGLGMADMLLGVLFSVAKIALVVSVLFSWFDTANKNYEWADRQTVEQSRWYEPVKGITLKLTPYFEELADKFLD